MTMTNKIPLWVVWGVPVAVLLLILCGQYVCIMYLNGGVFTYTLDDAYIHLSLAENISQGHYGINLGEFSSPSSSIVWPFLLSLFAGFSWFEYVPITVNVLASVAVLFMVVGFCLNLFMPIKLQGKILALAVGVLLIISGNLTGLVFTGMEHSVQLLLAVGLVVGTVAFLSDRRGVGSLVVLAIIAPLIRYEMLAVSAATLWFLWRCKQRAPAVMAGICIAILLGAFSFYLHSLGLGFFPNSVAAKSEFISTGGAFSKIVKNILTGIFERRGRGVSLLALLAGFLFFRFSTRSELKTRLCCEWAGIAILLHFCCGKFGWFSRYEIYIWVSSVLMMLVVLADRYAVRFSESASPVPLIGICGFVFCTSLAYFYALIMTPVAANNIYEQHYQTRRFLVDFYKRPVAINDIGLPTFRNDIFVLDIWGLASRKALEYRSKKLSPEWMDVMSAEHGIDCAVIYDTDYRPAGWVHLADWSLSRRRITPENATVSVFARDVRTVPELTGILTRFKETMPVGIKWVWVKDMLE